MSTSNHEWAKEVNAKLADLNALLDEAVSRDVIVGGTIAMVAWSGEQYLKPIDEPSTITLMLAERL